MRRSRRQVLDVGCGIGGPLRAISGFTGAAVIGVNNNAYQARARSREQTHTDSPGTPTD